MMTVVAAGRAKLQGPAGEGSPPVSGRRPVNGHHDDERHESAAGDADDDREGFFDQDRM
jgi:hypothetical protein